MTKIGTIRGDFKILEKVDSTHYKCQCIHCGTVRVYSATSVESKNKRSMRCLCPHEVVKVCRQCKKEFKTDKNAVFCSPGCRVKYYNSKKEKGEHIYKLTKGNPKRKIDDTTRMLVCVYTAEGLSIKEIAMWLKRSEATIRRILTSCRKNGKYRFYIDNSPILQIRGIRKCT